MVVSMYPSQRTKGAKMTDRELLQQALDALEKHVLEYETTEALRARLAQPEPEPTAYLCENAVGHKYFRWKKPSSEYKPIALYTAHATPQRIWQGLTHEEHMEILTRDLTAPSRIAVAEAKLKEKNNG